MAYTVFLTTNQFFRQYSLDFIMLLIKYPYFIFTNLVVSFSVFLSGTAMSAESIGLQQKDSELLIEAIAEISYQLEEVDAYTVSDEVKYQLLDLLSHGNDEVRDYTSYTFELIANTGDVLPKPLMEKLIERLNEQKVGSVDLARVIAHFGKPTQIPSLTKLIDSSSLELLQSLVDTLGDIGHEDALPALFKTLKHKNEDVKISSVKAIGKIEHRDAVVPLIEALSDSSDYVRDEAAVALGELSDKRAFGPLIELLNQDPHEDIIRALEQLDGASAVPFLIKGLAEDKFYEDTAVRAMNVIKEFESEKQALDALVTIVKNKNREDLTRMKALDLIGNTEDQQVGNLLLKLVLDEKESRLVRRWAIRSLGDLKAKQALGELASLAFEGYSSDVPLIEKIARLGSSEISDLLTTIRQDQDSDIRKEAILAIGKIRDQTFFKPLLSVLREKGVNDRVLINTIEALGFMGRKEAVKPLIAFLKSDSKYLRKATVVALGEINDDSAIPTLIRVLKEDEDSYTRSSASKALGNTAKRSVIPALIESLHDSSYSVRHDSRAALVKLLDASLVTQFIDDLLNDEKKAQYRKEVIEILLNVDQPDVIEALRASMKNENKSIKIAAMQALGTLKLDTAVDEILEMLANEEDEYLVQSAILALDKIGNPKAIPMLIKLTHNLPSQRSSVSALCTFKNDVRVEKVLSEIRMNGANTSLRKKARCTH